MFPTGKPLTGTKVLELSTMVTASMATMMLAAQGAEVIKIEPAGLGDTMRYIGSQKNGMSGLFANCNRGKRSLAVDLKTNTGVEIVRRLARDADVLVHNYRPGVMDRLGLGSDVLRQANERLIFAAISGFGTEGPLANAPAFDHVVQALSGITDAQSGGGDPEFVRTLVCDKITAYTVCQGVTAALLERATTQKGQHMDVSMLESALFFLWPDGMMNQTLLDDDVTPMPPLSELYWTYEARDGFLAIAAISDAHWQNMFRILGREDLNEDERFDGIFARVAHMKALKDEVLKGFLAMALDDVLKALQDADVPAMPCLSREDVITHPQVQAMNIVETVSHKQLGRMNQIAPPVRLHAQQGSIDPGAPALGEHSVEIVEALGLGAETLVSDGIITVPPA